MNNDLAFAIRIAKDTRSAVGNLDYRISKLLDGGNDRQRRDGSLIVRAAACQLIAAAYKQSPLAVAKQFWGDDAQLKSAVGPARTDTAGWAAELIAAVTAEIPDRLLPQSVFAQLHAAGLALSFSGDDIPRVPYIAPVASGGWTAEGAPINVGALVVNAMTLPVKKCTSLFAVTRELLRGMPANIEAALQTIMTEDLRLMVDNTLLDATAADAIRPAGLRAGVTGLTPAVTGALADRIDADIRALLDGVKPGLKPVLIAANPQAIILSGMLEMLPVIRAPYLAAGSVIMLDAAAFASAAGAPETRASEEPVIHSDTSAQPIGTVGSPNVVAAPTLSMFQSACFALRTVIDINWALRRSGAVSWMTGVSW